MFVFSTLYLFVCHKVKHKIDRISEEIFYVTKSY